MSQSIRTVTVEILRKGPPHNQLLSPLTEYLGICGESGAGSVSIPYEQVAFNAQLAELRYPDDEEQDQAPRQRALRTLGRDLGEVLGQIPGLAGALTNLGKGEELLNLRLVTSASELALLPFELAKVPSGTGKPTDDWLALQAATPVCLTRRFRSVLPSTRHWPKTKKPRILFIVGLDIDEKLRTRHREILEQSVAPWSSKDTPCLWELGPGEGGNSATVCNIRSELAKGYQYVHILTHGAESSATETPTYGLWLPSQGEDEADVLTGDRFASVLRTLPPGVNPPACVLVASCDSANQSDVLAPGGSFAHALHLVGIPLVVASQFPLTVDASVSLTEALYTDMLWGEHPLEILSRARARLHAEFAYTHDWASLVIYDALPEDMHRQLDEVRYQRARNALESAQEQIAEGHDTETTRTRAQHALCRPPSAEAYAREREGLRASHEKQMAEMKYRMQEYGEARQHLYGEARQHLMEARQLYRNAARRFLEPGNAVQRNATLHWVMTPSISLDRVMGEPSERGAWWVGYHSASIEMENSDEKHWALGSLAELWLLRLFEEELSDEERKDAANQAKHHAREIRRLLPRGHFAVHSTQRQFSRYADMWSKPEFAENMEFTRSPRWDDPETGVKKVAEDIVEILQG